VRRWSSISPSIAASCPRTASRGSTRIRCASSTARIRATGPFADSAPDIDAFLTGAAQDFFGAVTAGLDAAGVAWERNARLVRGLDYYRHTAFEFVTDRLGAQGTVLGGGRYDGLIEALGGPPTAAVGWAAGIERLAMLLADNAVDNRLDVVIAVEDDGSIQAGMRVLADMRKAGIAADIVASGSPRKRFDKAAKSQSAGVYCRLAVGQDAVGV